LLGGISQANSDPLTIAAQEIEKLEYDLNKLINKTETENRIYLAKLKYNKAVIAKENLLNAQSDLLNAENNLVYAQNVESLAFIEKQFAQSAVDEQQPAVDSAYLTKQQKQTALDAANINLQIEESGNSPQTNTLDAYLYDCWTDSNYYNSSPPFGCDSDPISMGPWSNINFNFGSGGPAGLEDDYQIRWIGYIKTTEHWTPQFRTCGDDGMILKISGLTVIDDWVDRGGQCGTANGYYMVSTGWEPIEVWWYENGGGANGSLQWNIGNGWTVVPSNVFSITIPQTSPEYDEALAAQVIAQQEYNYANSIYINENNLLSQYQSAFNVKAIEYSNAVDVKEDKETDVQNAENNLNTAQNNYDAAIIEMQSAIIDAKNEYNKQWQFEENQRIAAAIAQAIANQPQTEPTPELSPKPEQSTEPTPESTIEPSPEPSLKPTPTPQPSPEQTEPDSPNPEPTGQTDGESNVTPSPEPEPTQEPQPKPSSQPTDTAPKPTPESSVAPVEPSPKPSPNNNTTEDLTRVLANLTSKDNVTVKLTPEQMAVVGQSLMSLTSEAKSTVAKDFGIKTEEIAILAQVAQENPAVAIAIVTFAEKAAANENAPMPYTLADAISEENTKAFLSNPIGTLINIDLEKVLSPSEWGKDMTDDQREKAQEVIIPVILVSNIVSSVMSLRRL
jgi:hypothetical protein